MEGEHHRHCEAKNARERVNKGVYEFGDVVRPGLHIMSYEGKSDGKKGRPTSVVKVIPMESKNFPYPSTQ